MKENGADLDQIIKEEIEKEAGEIQEIIQNSDAEDLPEDRKERIHQKLQEQIESYEREKVYKQLSQEDREALELGKQIQKERQEEKVRRGKGWGQLQKAALNLAAVMALVLVLGITSVGGPERFVEIMKRAVGGREVVQVDSDEENLKIAEEQEEEAYQEIKDAFGVDPVKIIIRPKELKFVQLEMEPTLQVAEMYYQYKGENIVYFINASYSGASWGMDTDDTVIDTYYKEIQDTKIEVKEYRINAEYETRYSASYKYKGVEYFLIGTMDKENFELIIENLYFL